MSRTLAVGVVVIGSLAGANAQQPNAPGDEAVQRARRDAEVRRVLEMRVLAEREAAFLQAQALFRADVAMQGQLVRRLWSDEQLERLVFQQDRSASVARQRLDQVLSVQIASIDRACS